MWTYLSYKDLFYIKVNRFLLVITSNYWSIRVREKI